MTLASNRLVTATSLPSPKLAIDSLLQQVNQAYQRSRGADNSSQERLFWQEQCVDLAGELIQRQQLIEGLHYLARVRMDQGHYSQAMAQLQQALLLSDPDPVLHYSLGHCYLLQGHLEQALNSFAQSWEIDPEASHADAAIGYTLLEMGKAEQAFGVLRRIVHKRPNDLLLQQKFLNCLQGLRPDQANPELLSIAEHCLQQQEQDVQVAEGFISQLLQLSYGQQWQLHRVCQDPLLLQSLTRMLICHPNLELTLRSMRRELLLSSVADNQIPEPWFNLVSALARQCQMNEGLWSVTKDEADVLAQLQQVWQQALSRPEISGQDLASVLGLMAMYQPLGKDIPLAELQQKTAYPNWLNDLITPLYQQQRNWQQALASQQLLLQETCAQDAVSRQVQQQYEQWPYPSWQQLNAHEKAHLSQILQSRLGPFLVGDCLTSEVIQVLVAGCGTGLHAVNLAKHFYHTQVTAVDLSAASLKYAASKAMAMGVNNVTWQQADLLNLPASLRQQQFGLIECSGVLHHLGNPLAGLQALLPMLAPDGLIKIALYSHKARTAIRHLRQELSKYRPHESLTLMQQVRDMILADSDNPAWQGLVGGYDFCSASGLKDLLFHECEHQFKPSDIQRQLLDPCQLEVVGLVTTHAMQRSFYRTFGKDAPLTDLGLWQRLEAFEPMIFAGMIQLYARRKTQ